MSWLAAFLLTEAIEAPLYLVAQRGSARGWAARLAIALGPSALTHPLLHFPVRAALEPWLGFWGFVAVGELAVFLAEGAYLRALEVPHPWRWSLAANATSLGIGLALWAVGWW